MIGVESLALFLLVILITYLVVYRWKRQRFNDLVKNLPGDDGISFFELIWLILTVPRKQYVRKVLSYIKDDLPMTKVSVPNNLLVLTKNADFINKIFNSPQTYNKPKVFYQGFLIDKGMIALSGDEHKRHRKIFNKAFTPKMLQRLPEIFDEKSKKILRKLEEKIDRGEFEVMDYVGAYSLEAFGKSNMNYESDFFQSEYYEVHKRFFSLIMDALPYLMLGFRRKFLNLFQIGGQITSGLGSFKKLLNAIIAENHRSPASEENLVINLLLNPKNKFDNQEIFEEFASFTEGAFETSTKTMSIALMMLGMHKDIQQKLVHETENVFNHETNIQFSIDLLHKLPYLDAVVKETMRLFTLAPFIGREASDEVDINGYLIPKGTIILMCLHAMHRDEKYFGSDAHLFRPERFLEGLQNPNAFVPFAGGRRICIGYRYAMISMKIFLINFLRDYRVDCQTKFEELETELTFSLNFVNGYKIGISKRYHKYSLN